MTLDIVFNDEKSDRTWMVFDQTSIPPRGALVVLSTGQRLLVMGQTWVYRDEYEPPAIYLTAVLQIG